jgi:cytochrome c biogenesis protein CcmG/thiol:disulfide interchange protein DsbE
VKAIKIILVCLVLILLVLILTKCNRPTSEQRSEVEVGKAAPLFKLRNLTGGEVSLDQYKGKVVVLDFWATWCGPCRMTMPLLENLQKEYGNKFSLLTINLQEPDDVVRDYVRTQNLHPTVLLDENGAVGQTYGTDMIPMQVLIDRNGIVRDIKTGFSPRTISELKEEINKLQN